MRYPLEMANETFLGSRTRHGTASGHSKHITEGSSPCPACMAAKATYDAERASKPGHVLRNRAGARAQTLAEQELRHRHEEEYRELYVQFKERIYEELGLEPRMKQNWKGQTESHKASWRNHE